MFPSLSTPLQLHLLSLNIKVKTTTTTPAPSLSSTSASSASLSLSSSTTAADDDGLDFDDTNNNNTHNNNKVVRSIHEFLSKNPSYVPSSVDLIAAFDSDSSSSSSISIVPNCMGTVTTTTTQNQNYNQKEEHIQQLQIATTLLDHMLARRRHLQDEDTIGDDDDDAQRRIRAKKDLDLFVNSIGNIFHGTTPLVAAVNAENEHVVKLLLEEGKAIPQQVRTTTRDTTTLVSCVGGTRYDHPTTTTTSNDSSSPPPPHPSRKAMTPLMHASRKGHVGITKFLLDAILVDELTQQQQTNRHRNFCPISDVYDEQAKNALMHACSEGHTDVCRLLIEYGVKWRMTKTTTTTTKMDLPEETDDDDDDDAVIRREQREIKSKVVNSYKVDTALWYACGHGHADVARLLLDCGALPEYRADGTIYSSTPLMEACEWGHLAVVKLLLKQDGTDTRIPTGRKALRLAQEPGYTSVVEEMQSWTRRLNGLEGLLTLTSTKDSNNGSKRHDSTVQQHDGQNDDDEKLYPGLLPSILEKTEERRTLTFQLVRVYSEMITTHRQES